VDSIDLYVIRLDLYGFVWNVSICTEFCGFVLSFKDL